MKRYKCTSRLKQFNVIACYVYKQLSMGGIKKNPPPIRVLPLLYAAVLLVKAGVCIMQLLVSSAAVSQQLMLILETPGRFYS